MNFSSKRIHVYGMVQGIGFRPFVKRLAIEQGICGNVMNSGGIVIIEAYGEEKAMNRFVHSLISDAPKGAFVEKIEETDVATVIKSQDFQIISSEDEEDKLPPYIPVDLSICSQCEIELLDSKNRRYRYPFISCTACGPRYSIIHKIPYDRGNITMNSFKMCTKCKNEYENVDNSRCHAQTIACHSCGPKLLSMEREDKNFNMDTEQILAKTVDILKAGGIIAVKDIGGYHLACMANDKRAVDNLRQIKGREKKPFAVMFRNTASVHEYCEIDANEQTELESTEKPIVLLRKKKDFLGNVCANSYETGAMLPCNPLQILLLNDIGNIPLVMTSGNKSGESIITRDEEMKEWFKNQPLINMVLYHEREILVPLDDSLLHVVNGRTQIIRRARGYVPKPIGIEDGKNVQAFAAGGDLKSSMCLYKNGRAYLSQYLGDVENDKICELYTNTFARMSKMLNINPDIWVVDKHPFYNSVKLAKELMEKNQKDKSCDDAREQNIDSKNMIFVQHHFAHAASVMAEHGLRGKTLAVVWDGTGYGDDGNVWGGEFIYFNGCDFQRIGHISCVKLIGGNEGARNAETILYGYAAAMPINLKEHFKAMLPLDRIKRFETVEAALRLNINTVNSTSMGRLFDAVSAALGINMYNDYEGECAGNLEYSASRATLKMKKDKGYLKCNYEAELISEMFVGNTVEIFQKIMWQIIAGACTIDEIALEFHYMLCNMIVEFAEKAGEKFGTKQIVLSGGTFQNRILLSNIIKSLEQKKFNVYINEKVPSGDGGIALGQLYTTVWR